MAHSYPGMTRRGFCLCCLSAPAVTAETWLTPRQAFAQALGIVQRIQAAAATTPIAIHRLRGGIAALEGSGGNVAVLSGPDGKVLIDAGIAVSQPQMATALAALGPEPVTHLINTHWHFDHTNGNEWLRESRPSILAHENARKHLLVTQRVEDWSYDFAPLSAAALPSDLMADERHLTLNQTNLALRYYGPAHTDSDISVYFKEPDLLHTGDTFWNGIYPSSTIRRAEASTDRSVPPIRT